MTFGWNISQSMRSRFPVQIRLWINGGMLYVEFGSGSQHSDPLPNPVP